MTKPIDPNAGVDSPCYGTGEFAFIGYEADNTAHPIGVYKTYAKGRLAADSWMRATPKADRWEATPLYVSYDTEMAKIVAPFEGNATLGSGGNE